MECDWNIAKGFDASVTYSTDQSIELLDTYSGHRALSKATGLPCKFVKGNSISYIGIIHLVNKGEIRPISQENLSMLITQ